jgi:cbb3-type cytochrome oxidase subunit 3
MSIWKRYGYAWVTAALFLFSLAGHWLFAWFAYLDEQRAHNQPAEVSSYIIQASRDTLENWQSEFLQLLWQVGGLAFLLYVGSPQSKEEDDRMEEKLDVILRKLDPAEAERIIAELDRKYPGREVGPGPLDA